MSLDEREQIAFLVMLGWVRRHMRGRGKIIRNTVPERQSIFRTA